jgi:hypothetical protein
VARSRLDDWGGGSPMKFFLNSVRTNIQNLLGSLLLIAVGFLLSICLTPWIFLQPSYRDIIGNIIGGSIAVFAAVLVLFLQKYFEKEQRKTEERSKRVAFANFYRSTMYYAFMDARLFKNAKVFKDKFEISAMASLREKSFELLSGEAGRLSQLVYSTLLSANNTMILLENQNEAVYQDQRNANKIERDKLLAILDHLVDEALKYEDSFGAVMNSIMEKYDLKMSAPMNEDPTPSQMANALLVEK